MEKPNLTVLQPIRCALGNFVLVSHVPDSILQVRIDTDPSELPQASINPYSGGAKATEFTDES
jgi:hypothetical protein